MSCPWAKIVQPEPNSLYDIMSEEIARDLQAKEQKYISKNRKEVNQEEASKSYNAETVVIPEEIPTKALKTVSDDIFESDHMFALTLQKQYYDDRLKMTEQGYNISPEDFESELKEDEMEGIIDHKDWDRLDSLGRVVPSIPPAKPDLANSGRVNTNKLPSFLPEFEPDMDEEYRKRKLKARGFWFITPRTRKELAIKLSAAEFSKDNYTCILLYKLIYNKILERVNGIISIGTEAVILHADSNQNYSKAKQPLPRECVIKVFKDTLSESKDDCRLNDRIVSQMTKKTNNMWAEREMAHLTRLTRAGVNCPQFVALKRHLLVMSFIGQNRIPAPKLRYAKLSPKEYAIAYREVVEGVKALFEKANLIHADLTENNILWHDKKCYFIDTSQSVELSHENAVDFLYQDCRNIVKFFTKKRVPNVETPHEIFQYITGYDFNDKIQLESLKESFKEKSRLTGKPRVGLACNFETGGEIEKEISNAAR